METYIEFKHNGNTYMIAVKVIHRKVKWANVFRKYDMTSAMDVIKPIKITTSTRREELECWLYKLKRKIRKKRCH